MRVLHYVWFYLEINGREYRARWEDRGWSYASLRVDIEVEYEIPKYFFFGEKVLKKRWRVITWDSREEYPESHSPVSKGNSYDASKTRLIIERIIMYHHNETNHTERI
jgi:hypothetical protein